MISDVDYTIIKSTIANAVITHIYSYTILYEMNKHIEARWGSHTSDPIVVVLEWIVLWCPAARHMSPVYLYDQTAEFLSAAGLEKEEGRQRACFIHSLSFIHLHFHDFDPILLVRSSLQVC